MARRTIVQLEDDLDGGPADQTVLFALDGKAYEIDLSEENAELLRQQLSHYIPAARRITQKSGLFRRPGAGQRGEGDTAAIRAWALENGYAVGVRGRIPAIIMDAYFRRMSSNNGRANA